MNDSDTATVELTREEARELINALSEYQFQVSGRDEERALNVRELLKREFGFEDRHFEHDEGLLESFDGIFGDDDTHDVQLSKAEAAEVDAALADVEGSSDAEAETVRDLRERFERTFDLTDGGSA